MTALDKFKQDVDEKLASITPKELQKLFEDAGVKFIENTMGEENSKKSEDKKPDFQEIDNALTALWHSIKEIPSTHANFNYLKGLIKKYIKNE